MTMYSIVYFLLGNELYNGKPLSLCHSLIISFTGMCLLLTDCMILTNYHQVVSDGVNGAFPTLGALLLSLGVFSACRAIEFKLPDWLSFFTEGVLAVYLWHRLIIRLIMTTYGAPNGLLDALIISILIYVGCCCIGNIIKKIPVLCFFSKL